MKICYFGTYDKNRPRNRIIIDGLKENGVQVTECHYPVWRDAEDKSQVGLSSIVFACINYLIGHIILMVKYLCLPKHDAVIVGYLGQFDMLLARFVTWIKRKPLYLVAYLSLYDTVVLDRKFIKASNPIAKLIYFIDKFACLLADKVILDTQAYIDYFINTFSFKKEKFIRVFVGAAQAGISSQKSSNIDNNRGGDFCVLFYGWFIPLQGTEYIVKAAKLLEKENIRFTIIGTGQEYKRVRGIADSLQLNNINWVSQVAYEELSGYISRADVCLGIFADTDKTKRVIPNKAFQAIAQAKPLITADTPAARELFTDREDAILCQTANPKALADAILLLKTEDALRQKIASTGYQTYLSKCTAKAIGKQLLDSLT